MLTDNRLFAGIIADGLHVDPQNLAIAARLMGDRLCLVSDAMSTFGSDLTCLSDDLESLAVFVHGEEVINRYIFSGPYFKLRHYHVGAGPGARGRFRVEVRQQAASDRKARGAERLHINGGGCAPPIMAVMASADPGPIDSPTCWCPKLNQSPSCRGAGPITGSESTIVGRRPIQGVSSISFFIS